MFRPKNESNRKQVQVEIKFTEIVLNLFGNNNAFCVAENKLYSLFSNSQFEMEDYHKPTYLKDQVKDT